jgi:uncharacterized membrane protein (DUF4010 family)
MASTLTSAHLIGLCVALGIGLLIGAERERRKGTGPSRGAAGIRTFSVVALLGAVSVILGGGAVLAAAALAVGALAVASYRRTRDDDPGLTTEVALLLVCLLGGLAMREPLLAAGVGVALAGLLAARQRLHHFVSGVLTEQEWHDAMLFAAAALIVMPLAPDRFMGPFEAINPRAMAKLIVLVMAIGALGYIATRALGSRYGLPLAGLAGGFVSSTATIHALGNRTAQDAGTLPGAVAGAVLSSIATLVQMAVVLALLQPALLVSLRVPLLAGAVVAVLYAAAFVRHALRAEAELPREELGRAFDPHAALGFAAVMGAVLVVSAALNVWLGANGTLLAALATGLVDPHATAAAIASQVNHGGLAVQSATLPLLAGLSANALMKGVVAWQSGGVAYAARIVPGLAAMVAAWWLADWLT